MRLQGVTFENWLRSHQCKDPRERWLRELYPWPVLSQVECGEPYVGVRQKIKYDRAEYEVILQKSYWQREHRTFRYRIYVESDGLGWHSRTYSDKYDMCGTKDAQFVTLFHVSKKEPLEKIARSFFARRWKDLSPAHFRSLAVSRFLAASIVSRVAERAYSDLELSYYPTAKLVGGSAPMFTCGRQLWLGYRYFSEQAFAMARQNAGRAKRIVVFYFADTKYQFDTTLPRGASVRAVSQVDVEELGSEHQDLILTLLRRLELPTWSESTRFEDFVRRSLHGAHCAVSDEDVHEALAALKRPCQSKEELRYQLAAGVVLNAWIENERSMGFVQRKKFYAFKTRIGELANWVLVAALPGVEIWVEQGGSSRDPILFFRVDGVDFSFHAIPVSHQDALQAQPKRNWSGVRLKPVAPAVLSWARNSR